MTDYNKLIEGAKEFILKEVPDDVNSGMGIESVVVKMLAAFALQCTTTLQSRIDELERENEELKKQINNQ